MDFSSIASSFGDFLGENGVALGIGAQAAGTMMRKRALDKVRAEQARLRSAEAAKQRAIQQKISAQNAQLLPQFTPEASEAERASIAAKYSEYMAPKMAVADAGEYSAGVASAPAEVKEHAERQLADARKKGASHSTALANMASFGGLKAAQSSRLNAAGSELGRLKDASSGWSSVLPYQLEGANAKGEKLMTASDIANGLGSISFLYGATAPKKPAPRPRAFDVYGGGNRSLA